MIRRRKPQKMGARQAPQIRCPAHLKWIRGFVCAVADKHDCEGKIEAAHVRTGTDGGMGVKPSDCHAIPLCASAHREQHNIGEAAFERKYQISMRLIAATLWARSEHRKKVEA